MKVLGTTERRSCEIMIKELNLPCTLDDFHRQYKESCVTNLENVYLLTGTDRGCAQLFDFRLRNYSVHI